jgi:Zn finger protein HypA/HybF involved in hydrogenase expression
MTRKSTTPKFIEKALRIHGTKYDYSLVAYKNSATKVEIICPEHGSFMQTPNAHLRGQGCPACGTVKFAAAKTKHQDVFIDEANQMHNHKYDYSKSVYVRGDAKVCIICPEHGEFYQTPVNHLVGQGCPKCGKIKQDISNTKTSSQFISESMSVHGDKYDYSLVEYTSAHDKLKIVCPEHGIFEQEPNNHLFGKGCPQCKSEKLSDIFTKSPESFFDDAIRVHGTKYDYSRTQYINARTKVVIICPMHGEFEQEANSHLMGHGCPDCPSTVSKLETIWLDSLGIPIEYRQKTLFVHGQRVRPDAYDPTTNTIYEFYGDYWHGNLNKYAANKMNNQLNKTFGELYDKTMQRETLLREAGYNLITIWESEFNQTRCT